MSNKFWITRAFVRHVPVIPIGGFWSRAKVINLLDTNKLSRYKWYPQPFSGGGSRRTTAWVLFPPFPTFFVPPNSTGVRVSTGPFLSPGIWKFHSNRNPSCAMAHILNPVGVGLPGTVVASFALPSNRHIISSTARSRPAFQTWVLIHWIWLLKLNLRS